MVGQHIRILKGGRWVHAVDCGDETVLHLVEDAPPPRVRRAYRPEFVAGAEIVEVVTHRERTFPAKEIVKRAYSRASNPTLAAMFQDSASFVEWCTTGRLAEGHNFAVDVPGVALAARAAPAPGNGAPAVKVARPAGPAAAPAKAKGAPQIQAAPRSAAPARAKDAAKRTAPAKAKAKEPARKVGARTKVAARKSTGKKSAARRPVRRGR